MSKSRSNVSKNVPVLSSKKNARKNNAKTNVLVTEATAHVEAFKSHVASAPVETVKATETQTKSENATQTNVVAQKAKCYTVTHANGAALTTQRPGVLAHIERMLRDANAETPVTKSDILASLVVAFPDREEAKMKVTLNMQVPSGFRLEKGYIIESTNKGYYFNVEKTEEYQKTHEKRGGKWVPKVSATV